MTLDIPFLDKFCDILVSPFKDRKIHLDFFFCGINSAHFRFFIFFGSLSTFTPSNALYYTITEKELYQNRTTETLKS